MKNNAISLPDSSTRTARPTVLIVDDSRLMRVAIKKILKDEFELIEAVDGEDAWSRLMEDSAIACVFSDLSMPNLDGYGLLERVRGSDDAHVRALPFIVITGKEGDLGGLLEEVRGHGATDLVGKPFKSDEIIARTRSLLAVDTTPAVVMAAVAETQEAPEASETHPVDEALIVDQAAAAEACRIHEEQEAARQAEEALAHRQAAEAEARRQREEDEARRIREEQETARRAEAAARQAAEQAEQERLAAEAAARQAEEEARICEELRTKARLMAEERERQRLAEEQALHLNPLQGLFVRLALPFMSMANRLLRLGKAEALDKLRKRLR